MKKLIIATISCIFLCGCVLDYQGIKLRSGKYDFTDEANQTSIELQGDINQLKVISIKDR